MKGGNFGSSKLISTNKADFIPHGHGNSLDGHAADGPKNIADKGKYLPGGRSQFTEGVTSANGTKEAKGKFLPRGQRKYV